MENNPQKESAEQGIDWQLSSIDESYSVHAKNSKGESRIFDLDTWAAMQRAKRTELPLETAEAATDYDKTPEGADFPAPRDRPLFVDKQGRQWEFMRDFDDRAVWASEAGNPNNSKLWEDPEAVERIRYSTELDRLTTQLEEQKAQAEQREQALLAQKEELERRLSQQAETISDMQQVIDEMPRRFQQDLDRAVVDKIKEMEVGKDDKIVRIYSPVTRSFEFAKVVDGGEESGERYSRVVRLNDPEGKSQLFFNDELDFWNAGPLDKRSAPSTADQVKERVSGKFHSGKKQLEKLAKLKPKSIRGVSEGLGTSLKDSLAAKKEKISELDLKQYRKRILGRLAGAAIAAKELITGGEEEEESVEEGRFRLNRHRKDEENPVGPPTDEELQDPQKRVKRVWEFVSHTVKINKEDKKSVKLVKGLGIGTVAVGSLFIPGVPQLGIYGGLAYGAYKLGKKKFGNHEEDESQRSDSTAAEEAETENKVDHVVEVDGFAGDEMQRFNLETLLDRESKKKTYNEIYIEAEGGDLYAILVDDVKLATFDGKAPNTVVILHGRDIGDVKGDPNKLPLYELGMRGLDGKRLEIGEPFDFINDRVARVKKVVCLNTINLPNPEELEALKAAEKSSIRDDFWALAGLRMPSAEELSRQT